MDGACVRQACNERRAIANSFARWSFGRHAPTKLSAPAPLQNSSSGACSAADVSWRAQRGTPRARTACAAAGPRRRRFAPPASAVRAAARGARARRAHHIRQLDLRAHEVQVVRRQQRSSLALRQSAGGAARTAVVRRRRRRPRSAHIAAALARLRRRGAARRRLAARAEAAHGGRRSSARPAPPPGPRRAALSAAARRRVLGARAPGLLCQIARGAWRKVGLTTSPPHGARRKGHHAAATQAGACTSTFSPGRPRYRGATRRQACSSGRTRCRCSAKVSTPT